MRCCALLCCAVPSLTHAAPALWHLWRCVAPPSGRGEKVYDAPRPAPTNCCSSSSSTATSTAPVVFPTNALTTSRYTFWNFLPLQLFEQFLLQPANLYFLFVGILQIIPAVSTTDGIPTMYQPLAFVVLVSALRAAKEDWEYESNPLPSLALSLPSVHLRSFDPLLCCSVCGVRCAVMWRAVRCVCCALCVLCAVRCALWWWWWWWCGAHTHTANTVPTPLATAPLTTC